MGAERFSVCRYKFGDDVIIGHTGAAGINTARIYRDESLKVAAGSNVHANCRKIMQIKGELTTLLKQDLLQKL